MSASQPPQNADEYNDRYMENQEVTGFGVMEVTQHFPCPFCAAPGWMAIKIIHMHGPHEPHTCKECGRSAQILVHKDQDATTIAIVQTGGENPPGWVPIRRKEETDG